MVNSEETPPRTRRYIYASPAEQGEVSITGKQFKLLLLASSLVWVDYTGLLLCTAWFA